MATPKTAPAFADDEILDFDEETGGETALTGVKREFADLDDDEEELYPAKKIYASHGPGTDHATTTILNLRSSLEDRDSTIAALKASLDAAKEDLDKWTSGFTNDSLRRPGTTADPAVVVQAMVHDLKLMSKPSLQQTRRLLLDPAMHAEFTRMKIEKGQTVGRILQKKRLCDTLSMQVAILQNLLEQNQAQCRLYQSASGSTSSAQVHLRMPRSMEWGSSNSEVASMNSEIDLRKGTPDRNVHTDLASVQSLEESCDVDDFICDYFVDEQRPCAAKRLHLPFVILATTPDANVDISMSSDPPYQVHLQLDRDYCLMDHIQMIKMLPEGRGNKQQWQPEPV